MNELAPVQRVRKHTHVLRDRGCRRKKLLARNAEVYRVMRSRVSGIDIVAEVVPQFAINLYLRNIAGSDSPVEARDALFGEGDKTTIWS